MSRYHRFLVTFLFILSPLLAAPPYIEYLYPAGSQQGKKLIITLGGKSLDDAHTVTVSGEGVTGKVLEIIQPTEKQIAEAKKLDEIASQSAKIEITIAPNAPLGVRDLRIMTKDGMSNRFRFAITAFNEVMEVEPNNSAAQAQRIESLPCIINGQFLTSDVDRYRFSAKAGQKILIEVHARAIKPFLADAVPGWFQARITLFDSTGKKIADADDYRFNPDPVLMWTAPADGDYDIEIKDAIARGRADLVYRIKIGELPYLTDIFPLGGPREKQSQIVTLSGFNLPVQKLRITFDKDSLGIAEVGAKTPYGLTNTRPFEIGDLPEIFEKEPNINAKPQRVTHPITINGRIDKPGDTDAFIFTAKKGETLVFNVMARRLGSPLDSNLRLVTRKGNKPLGNNDDYKDLRYGMITHHADSRLQHTFEEDGEYMIVLSDTQGKGGPEYAYRLHISPPQPDFELFVMPDNLSVPAGGNVAVKLKAVRFDGFDGPIDLQVEGLPEGFELNGAKIPAGKNDVTFTLSVPENAKPSIMSPRFYAEGTGANKEKIRHQAKQAEDLMQAFFYYHTIPVDQGYLIISEAAPFRVVLDLPEDLDVLEFPLHTDVEIPVRIIRNQAAAAAMQAKANAASASQSQASNKEKAKGKGRGKDQGKKVTAAPNPLSQNIRVTAKNVRKGVLPTAAVIAKDEDRGVVKVKFAEDKLLDSEGVLLIEGTIRGRGTKISSMAPAIRYKVTPAPEGAVRETNTSIKGDN